MIEKMVAAGLLDLSELKLISDALGALLESPLSADDENAVRALRGRTDALWKVIELLEPLTSWERRKLTEQYLSEEQVLSHADAIRRDRDLQKAEQAERQAIASGDEGGV